MRLAKNKEELEAGNGNVADLGIRGAVEAIRDAAWERLEREVDELRAACPDLGLYPDRWTPTLNEQLRANADAGLVLAERMQTLADER